MLIGSSAGLMRALWDPNYRARLVSEGGAHITLRVIAFVILVGIVAFLFRILIRFD